MAARTQTLTLCLPGHRFGFASTRDEGCKTYTYIAISGPLQWDTVESIPPFFVWPCKGMERIVSELCAR